MSQQPLDHYTHLTNGGYLIIPEALLTQLRQYRQKSVADCEAGGVLIGTWRVAGKAHQLVRHAEITDVTVPVKGDSRTRFGFIRRSKHHLEKIKHAWSQSKHKQSYLGEWHTHPEPHPKPSSIDLHEWRNNLNSSQAIVIIVGIKSEWIGLWNGSEILSCERFRPDI